jgi:hypothetical protein
MLAAAVFVAAAGVTLFFFSEHTSQYFAWTIKPPVTAAFLGGGYLAVNASLLLALRSNDWSQARVGVWVVTTGLLVILLASLLHLDRFHLHSPVWTAKVWAWSWLVLYIGLVPGLVAALWSQRRIAMVRAEAGNRLPVWLRNGQRVLGILMTVIGLALFAAPDTSVPLWPWPLTPLTARMVGSFYLAIAVSLFVAARENNFKRIHVASVAYLVFALLQGINAVRYPAIQWQTLSGWLLAGTLLALLIVGALGVRGYIKDRMRSVT